MPLVSLAGYTSSGKTTVFNKLASESREESPNLFTTLTTTTRAVSFSDSRKRVMLSDTVGFVSRLPTYMIESFKSTLEELTYADLVLLMLDVSENEESVRIKLNSCRETLAELSVDRLRFCWLDKIDLLKDGGAGQIRPAPSSAILRREDICDSRGGMTQLKNRIMQKTYPNAGFQPRAQAESDRVRAVRPASVQTAEPARPGPKTSAYVIQDFEHHRGHQRQRSPDQQNEEDWQRDSGSCGGYHERKRERPPGDKARDGRAYGDSDRDPRLEDARRALLVNPALR